MVIVRKSLSLLLSVWGGLVVGAGLGYVVGMMMGPVLAQFDLGAALLEWLRPQDPLELLLVAMLESFLRSFEGTEIALALASIVYGLLAGIVLGASTGMVIGAVTGAVSTISNWALERPSWTSLLLGSRVDFFFGHWLSSWLMSITKASLLCTWLGSIYAPAVMVLGLAFGVEAPLITPHIGLVFGASDAALIGGTVGYFVGVMGIVVQRLFPWALPAGAVGAIIAELTAVRDPVVGYSYVCIAAVAGHALSLVVGPLKGRFSPGRDGFLFAAAALWLLLHSPVLSAPFLILAIVRAPADAGGILASTAGSSAGTGLGLTVPAWSFKASFVAVSPWVTRWQTPVGAVAGLFAGSYFDFPGGLALWMLTCVFLLHSPALWSRWRAAGAQAQALKASGATAGSIWAAIGAGFKLALVIMLAVIVTVAAIRMQTLAGRESTPVPSPTPSPTLPEPRPRPSVPPVVPAPAPQPALVATPAPTPAPAPQPALVAPPAPAPAPDETARDAEQLVHRYYADLNSGDFDANRYFARAVERYISMKRTGPAAINKYILQTFPTQFRQHHYEVEPGSLLVEDAATRQYAFTVHSRYFRVKTGLNVDQRYKVSVRLSPEPKIDFFRQFEPFELHEALP